MPKVTVTANQDFYDHANSMQRKKGQTFILREEYAKSLKGSVKIGDSVSREAEAQEEKKIADAKARTTTAPAKKAAAPKKGGNTVKAAGHQAKRETK
jgi:hypothetical protein